MTLIARTATLLNRWKSVGAWARLGPETGEAIEARSPKKTQTETRPNHARHLTSSGVHSCLGLPLPCFFHVYGYRPLNRQAGYPCHKPSLVSNNPFQESVST